MGESKVLDQRDEKPPMVQVEVLRSMRDVAREEWDSLITMMDSPFIEHEWLACLEDSNTVSPSTGWYPFHLAIREAPDNEGNKGKLIGAVPMYAKTHSMGEFVFDHSWADAAYYQLGIEYYPKLVAAVPFTPATGKRILTDPDADRLAIVRTASLVSQQLAKANNFSSVHFLFCPEDEATETQLTGYVTRKTVQNHFTNLNPNTGEKFTDFNEYIMSLKPNRRKALRRERKKIYEEEGIHLEVYVGDKVTDEVLDTAYKLYETTCDKYSFQAQYLNKEFFQMLHKGDFRQYLVIVLAKRGNNTIAGTFNIQKGETLFGRYWGCFEEVPYLYFETCYYKLIEHVIENSMSRMEAGAGSSGGGKLLRGFDASITRSSHFILNPSLRAAVEQFVFAESLSIEDQKEALNDKFGAFKSSGPSLPPESESPPSSQNL